MYQFRRFDRRCGVVNQYGCLTSYRLGECQRQKNIACHGTGRSQEEAYPRHTVTHVVYETGSKEGLFASCLAAPSYFVSHTNKFRLLLDAALILVSEWETAKKILPCTTSQGDRTVNETDQDEARILGFGLGHA